MCTDPGPSSAGQDPPAVTMSSATPAPLPQAEYEAIYLRVPRLTVELVIISSDRVLLARRQSGPCAGLWHIPGGTVRFGEPLTDAVHRVAPQELGWRSSSMACSDMSSTRATSREAWTGRWASRSASTWRHRQRAVFMAEMTWSPRSPPFHTTCTTSRRSSSEFTIW